MRGTEESWWKKGLGNWATAARRGRDVGDQGCREGPAL